MKKVSLLLFITIIILSSSCSSETTFYSPSDVTNDIVILYGVEDGIFNNEFISPEKDMREEIIVDSQKTTISIGSCEFDVYPVSIQYSDMDIIKKYRNENDNCVYQTDENGYFFSIQSQSDCPLKEFSFEELSEETLKLQISSFVLNLLPDENLEKYNICTRTRILKQNSDSAWGENVDCFYYADEKKR